MKDREKILRYFAASGDESKDMAMRLLDLADAVDRGRPFAVGPFMAPFARQIGQHSAFVFAVRHLHSDEALQLILVHGCHSTTPRHA